MLLSGVGGGSGVSGVTLTLDDDASSALPLNGAVASGTYSAVNYSGITSQPSRRRSGPTARL